MHVPSDPRDSLESFGSGLSSFQGQLSPPGRQPPIRIERERSAATDTTLQPKKPAAFVRTKGIGFLAYWAIDRDQPGIGGIPMCSGAQTKTFEFLRAFETAL